MYDSAVVQLFTTFKARQFQKPLVVVHILCTYRLATSCDLLSEGDQVLVKHTEPYVLQAGIVCVLQVVCLQSVQQQQNVR
jgi:hypothetical protein